MNKLQAIAKALQSGRQLAPRPDSAITLRVTVHDSDNTRHERVLRLESEDLAKVGDLLEQAAADG
jgi:hypothetical protein